MDPNDFSNPLTLTGKKYYCLFREIFQHLMDWLAQSLMKTFMFKEDDYMLGNKHILKS